MAQNIKVGDHVQIKAGTFAGAVGRVTIRSSMDGLLNVQLPIEFVPGLNPTDVERVEVSTTDSDQLTDRAIAKARRQQAKAAALLEDAARTLNEYAAALNRGGRVESIQDPMLKMNRALFFIGQADALLDLDEWIGEV